MMTARQSMEEIARLLEQALEPDADHRDLRGLIVGAHTHAILQASFLRRAEARAELEVYRNVDGRAVH